FERIYLRGNRFADKGRYQRAYQWRHIFENHLLNIYRAVHNLLFLIESQIDGGFRGAFELHAPGENVVTARERQRHRDFAAGKPHSGFDIAAFRVKHHYVTAGVLKSDRLKRRLAIELRQFQLWRTELLKDR